MKGRGSILTLIALCCCPLTGEACEEDLLRLCTFRSQPERILGNLESTAMGHGIDVDRLPRRATFDPAVAALRPGSHARHRVRTLESVAWIDEISPNEFVVCSRGAYAFALSPERVREIFMHLDVTGTGDSGVPILPYPMTRVRPVYVSPQAQLFDAVLTLSRYRLAVDIDLPVFRFAETRDSVDVVYQISVNGTEMSTSGSRRRLWIERAFSRSVIVPCPDLSLVLVIIEAVMEIRSLPIVLWFRPSAGDVLALCQRSLAEAPGYFMCVAEQLESDARRRHAASPTSSRPRVIGLPDPVDTDSRAAIPDVPTGTAAHFVSSEVLHAQSSPQDLELASGAADSRPRRDLTPQREGMEP